MSATPAQSLSDKHALATVRTIADLRAAVDGWRRAGARIGLVPTMGALHEGHLALVRRARADCDRVVASLFVNPTQFNDPSDLRAYPRDEAGDAALLAAEGTDLLFAPPVEEVYPEGFATSVRVAALADCLCGAARPGHMDGVATVVAKLLNQARPDLAYFGEKDFQQLQIIRRMTADLDLPVTVVGVPTVRAADGLAFSSRNVLLTPEQRRAAPALHRALAAAAAELHPGAAAEPVLEAARAAIAGAGFDAIDYLELRGEGDLALLERVPADLGARPTRLFAAARLGGVRLIDNLPLR